MKTIYVYTQQELEAALAKGDVNEIVICRGSAEFALSGSAQVRASGSAQVRASGSAQVTAYGSAQVTAYGSAQVTAYDSAQVRAYDSAQVTAYGSAQVTAYDSAQVRAYDSAQVTASRYVAVTKHSRLARVDGGTLIEIPQLTTVEDWLEYFGVEVKDGIAVLYKAVSAEFISGHGMSYAPGTTPSAPDWDPVPECGGGLHFCAHPGDCLSYYDNPDYRFVACPVRVDEIVVHPNGSYPNKVKAPRVVEGCYEVDIDGKVIAAAPALVEVPVALEEAAWRERTEDGDV